MTVDHEQGHTQRLTEPEDIFRVIKSLELYRSFITVTIADVKGVASSLVLDANLENHQFSIDELNDDIMQSHVQNGASLVFRAAYGGIQVSGESRVIDRQDSIIVLSFPAKVLHRQRRAAYRANLSTPVAINLASSARDTIAGEITDVSAEGIGVVFSKFIHPPIEPGELFTDARFYVNDLSWQIALIAKHPNYDKMNDKYRCGFSFHQLNLAEEKAINHWVLELQRQQRRNYRLGHPKSP